MKVFSYLRERSLCENKKTGLFDLDFYLTFENSWGSVGERIGKIQTQEDNMESLINCVYMKECFLTDNVHPITEKIMKKIWGCDIIKPFSEKLCSHSLGLITKIGIENSIYNNHNHSVKNMSFFSPIILPYVLCDMPTKLFYYPNESSTPKDGFEIFPGVKYNIKIVENIFLKRLNIDISEDSHSIIEIFKFKNSANKSIIKHLLKFFGSKKEIKNIDDDTDPKVFFEVIKPLFNASIMLEDVDHYLPFILELGDMIRQYYLDLSVQLCEFFNEENFINISEVRDQIIAGIKYTKQNITSLINTKTIAASAVNALHSLTSSVYDIISGSFYILIQSSFKTKNTMANCEDAYCSHPLGTQTNVATIVYRHIITKD